MTQQDESYREATCILCDREPTIWVTTATGGQGRASLPYCNYHYLTKYGEHDD